MRHFLLIAATGLLLAGCSSKVLVKKDTCKDVYGGVLMECESVKK